MDSRLVVTGVKEIKKCHKPRGKLDLKLCISGISIVTTEEPLVRVISGVKLHTPFVTPSTSGTSICHCFNKKNCDPIVRDSTSRVKSFLNSSPSKIFKANAELKRMSAEAKKEEDKEKETGGVKICRNSTENENEKRRSKESKRSFVVKDGEDSGIEEGGVESDKQLLKVV